jgi:hypothetical protein
VAGQVQVSAEVARQADLAADGQAEPAAAQLVLPIVAAPLAQRLRRSLHHHADVALVLAWQTDLDHGAG